MPETAPMPAPPAPLVVVGALHVDELLWPLGTLAPRASNPVRRERRAGGVGANVARAAAGAGSRDVVLVAALGDDGDAAWLRAELAADGVDVVARVVEGCASGRYTVVHDEGGELFVGLAETGLAEALGAADVRTRLPGAFAALVLDANLGADCIGALLNGARSGDAGAPRVGLAVSPAKARRLVPGLASLDLLFCNRREAAALGGLDVGAPVESLADALGAVGAARFVLSDGAAAVLVQAPEGRVRVPVPTVAVAGSVNGAGDALAGATLARWLDGVALVDAVRDAGLPAAAGIVRCDAVAPSFNDRRSLP